MIPNDEYTYDIDNDDDIDENIQTEESSDTYYLNVETGHIEGRINGDDAIRQAIFKILNTERYDNPIYSWDYGCELNALIGENMQIVMMLIQSRVEDALLQDDRITKITDFELEQIDKKQLSMSFTVVTSQNQEIPIESEVNV